ncbi:hypothetical protein ACFQY5_25730 [Paeniroseomonas aquatica]|uniref:DUF4175 domain-containing protein n=1 Tax=Paeniroseomonas aquatica TaxID=373043 RepID=A0ABT8AA36_9PROT|nr:hypothetical protein [Paeniroseomonas aquatica]MDN3566383.1 hypothetical protein [Paeniroseomonas aquatica]
MSAAQSRKAGSTWAAPGLLALASLIGLLAALLGDGAWDVLSWLGLGAPVVVIARIWGGRRG